MKNTTIAIALLFTSLLAFAPAALTSTASNSTFYYRPQVAFTQASPSVVSPQGIPLCKTSTGNNLTCYSPDFIRTAYNFPTTLDGSGQTIVIVDAFGSPTIANDLAVFDSHWGIPAPPSFTIICGSGGCPAYNPNNTFLDETGWAIETSLDVEYAHAMAPGANIVLDVASSPAGNAINVAESTVIPMFPGAIMSQSFGIPEYAVTANNAQIMQAEVNYKLAAASGWTVLASAGDFGATNGISTANALFPSSDPLVTSVGGTMGNPYFPEGTLTNCTSGTCTAGLATFSAPCTVSRPISTPSCTPVGYGGEQVWNEPTFGAAGGGAPSLLFSAPSYQNNTTFSVCTGSYAALNPTCARTTPDVSYNAAVDGGVLVFTSFLGAPIWFFVGGTSAGSPQWAAIFALANEARANNGLGPLGFANPTIYSIAESAGYSTDFHDIAVGNNQLVGTPVGFTAASGYDFASGWGTPNVSNLVTALT